MRNVFRNLTLLAFGEVAGKLLGLVGLSYMARTLGPEAFGEINVGLAVLGYLSLGASPGIHLYGTRCAASGEIGPGVVGPVTGLRLVLAVGLLIIVVSIVSMAEGSVGTTLVLLFALSLIPLSVSLDWYFQGRERMGLITGSRAIFSVVQLATLLVWVRGSGDAIGVPLAFLAGNVAASSFFLIAWLRSPDRALSLPRPSAPKWRDLLRRSIPMGLGSILAQVTYHFPPILIGVTLGTAAVGQFSAAMRVVYGLLIVDRAMSLTYFPIVSRWGDRDPARLAHASNQFLRLITVLVLPACLVTFVWAPWIVSLIYGPDYGQGADVLRILIWFFALTSLNTVFLFGLMGVGRDGRYARIMTVGTIAQLGLMLVMGSRLGLIGVSLGLVAGEAVVSVLGYLEYRRITRIDLPGTILKPAISGLAMALLLRFGPFGGRVGGLIAAMTVYLGALVLSRGVSRRDLLAWREEL